MTSQLTALGHFLSHTRPVWAPRPFAGRPVPLEADHPELAAWLLGMDPDRWDRAPWAHPHAPPLLRGWAAEATALARVERLSGEAPRWPRPPGVRGRKWDQVLAFAGVVLPRLGRPEGIVEWCSGKAHLGRSLAASACLPLRAVERDPALCDAGRALADRARVPAEFWCGDALSADLTDVVEPEWALVSLHACGDLTDAALESGAGAVAAAPCCFHRVSGERYLPRSAAGRACDPGLDRVALRLPTAEEVVASPDAVARRRRETAWRLALDQLVREATGEDRLHPVRTVPKSWLNADLQSFATRAAAKDGLPLPPTVDWEATEAEGWHRAREARALGMVRGLFRRPLEVWLALDRAEGLKERGYEVEVGTFCEPSVTPRDLVVVGRYSR